jgi:enoyl-CoA hydratase/carnithine racemase
MGTYQRVPYEYDEETFATKLLLVPEDYRHIIYKKKDGIADIVLNRPDVLNAMNHQTICELLSAFAEAEADDDVGVIILSGAGDKAFSAGDDMKDATRPGQWYEWMPGRKAHALRHHHHYKLMETIRSTFKPVIAAVHGYCIGGGLTIALASDIIIASETTQFGLPFSSQGAVIGTSFLAEAVGYHKACELLFTADLFDAKEAERIGILNHVVPHEQLQVKAMEMAEKITDKPTPIVSWQKWVLMWLVSPEHVRANPSPGATKKEDVFREGMK